MFRIGPAGAYLEFKGALVCHACGLHVVGAGFGWWGIIANDACRDFPDFREGRRIKERLCEVSALGTIPHLELKLE